MLVGLLLVRWRGPAPACGKNRRQTGAGTWANRSGNQRKQLTEGCGVNGGPKNTFRCKLGGAGTEMDGKRQRNRETERARQRQRDRQRDAHAQTHRVRARAKTAAACAKTRREKNSENSSSSNAPQACWWQAKYVLRASSASLSRR